MAHNIYIKYFDICQYFQNKIVYEWFDIQIQKHFGKCSVYAKKNNRKKYNKITKKHKK